MNIAKTLVLAALVLPATAVVAVAARPHPAYKLRHDNFEAMGRAMKGLTDEFKRPTPNQAALKAHSDALMHASMKVKGHFPAGTGPRTGVKTEALPVIWQKPVEFAAAADRLTGSTHALQAAVATGDMRKIQTATMAVGASCKNCHDTFRKPRG